MSKKFYVVLFITDRFGFLFKATFQFYDYYMDQEIISRIQNWAQMMIFPMMTITRRLLRLSNRSFLTVTTITMYQLEKRKKIIQLIQVSRKLRIEKLKNKQQMNYLMVSLQMTTWVGPTRKMKREFIKLLE